jgi:hypothetical protein
MIVVYNKQGKRIKKGVVKRKNKIVVHTKQEKKYIKKKNKRERRILLRSEHNQAMPFQMVVG